MSAQQASTFTRSGVYAALGTAGLLTGVATGRPALVAAAVPFAVAVVLGLVLELRPAVRVSASISPHTVMEGDTVAVDVDLVVGQGAARVEVSLVLPPGLEAAGPVAQAVRVPSGTSRRLVFPVAARRWGAHPLGGLVVRAMAPAGYASRQVELRPAEVLRVYPSAERARQLTRPLRTRSQTGSQTARTRAEGVEFAELRPYQHGDRWRDVNWRATARRGQPWINQRHPERNAEVVVFVDLFSPVALDRAVHVTASVVTAHLAERDRVGLVAYGGSFRWLVAGSGQRQLYRLLDALIDSRVIFTYAARDVTRIPRQMLPPGALLLAVSPLEDHRTVDALAGLRARGVDVAVIDLDTSDLLPPAVTDRDRLARRLWDLQRLAGRLRYRRLGIPVAEWRESTGLAPALAELQAWRRRAARVG